VNEGAHRPKGLASNRQPQRSPSRPLLSSSPTPGSEQFPANKREKRKRKPARASWLIKPPGARFLRWRTEAEGSSEDPLDDDLETRCAKWEGIQEAARNRQPTCAAETGRKNGHPSRLRDLYSPEFAGVAIPHTAVPGSMPSSVPIRPACKLKPPTANPADILDIPVKRIRDRQSPG